jgi:DNA gyrase/topoisomerase IV subunit A
MREQQVKKFPGCEAEARRCAAQVVLNNLYKHTKLQSRFPVNNVALVNGTPQTLNLKEFLTHFLDFRCEVIKRRARCFTALIINPCQNAMCPQAKA